MQFADVMTDATVPVKWLSGSNPNAEKLAFVKRATPALLDLARQLLGYDVNVCLRSCALKYTCRPSYIRLVRLFRSEKSAC